MSDVVPVRMTVQLCLAMDRGRFDEGEHFELVDEALSAFPHVFPQGGAAELMEESDVVAGSPLADFLAAWRHEAGPA